MTKLARVHGKILLGCIGGWFAQPEIEAASASVTYFFPFFALCSIKVSGWNGHYETMGAGAETSRQSRPFEW